MAYDDGMAEQMREDLAGLVDLGERKMFGGLCFMLQGNMLCGVYKGGAMYRVGKPRTDAALAVPGARQMDFTKRPMAGFVEIEPDGFADDDTRGRLTALAIENALSLPPK